MIEPVTHTHTHTHTHTLGFPGGSDSKEFACNAGDLGSVPRSGRFPGERNGNPLQYRRILENSQGQRSLVGYIVHGVAKSWTQLNNLKAGVEGDDRG